MDFFLPRFCISCSNKLGKKHRFICDLCYSKIELSSEKRINEEFLRKFSNDKYISDFYSAFVFYDESEIQKLIHSLKYEQNYHVGIFLGLKTGQIFNTLNKQWQADLIIPVPLHQLRKAERGFNQSNEISKGLTKELGIKKNSRLLKRNRFTKTQTKFTLLERKSNIEGAFSIKSNKNILGKR
ncbi:MAG: hypothetical protein OQJ81_05700, partial [Melioribacteraceae bacterium]|nr:hypothetical protein [Melioribacteraceae bacterium]